jgi:hypothetical protein
MKIEQNMVDKLKVETKTNTAANAVFHMLAVRERSRSTLTLGGLSQKMKQEGFKYPLQDYREVLRSLVKAGVGTPMYSKKGHIVGIHSIKVKLYNLGKSLCGERETEILKEVAKTPGRDAIERTLGITIHPIESLSIAINSKPVNIQFPQGISASELSLLIARLESK